MRASVNALAVAALFFASCPAAADPIKINTMGNFSIKPENLPQGCSLINVYNGEKFQATVTCDTQEHFSAGFAISENMKTDCEEKGGKYVCRVSAN